MKSYEFLKEAHHSIVATSKIGPWNVQIDSHAMVTLPERDISVATFSNIITHMCFMPNLLDSIPIGRGAYFQDTNSLVSLYLTRVGGDTIRVETALSPDMKPKPPLFRRPVPVSTIKSSKKDKEAAKLIRAKTLSHGRDAVSQDFEKNMSTPLNREQRRSMQKRIRRSK